MAADIRRKEAFVFVFIAAIKGERFITSHLLLPAIFRAGAIRDWALARRIGAIGRQSGAGQSRKNPKGVNCLLFYSPLITAFGLYFAVFNTTPAC